MNTDVIGINETLLNDLIVELGNYEEQIVDILNGMEVQPVRLVADSHDSYDVWNLENDIVNINDSYMRLSEFGSIEKRQMGNDIFKVDQQYQLIFLL